MTILSPREIANRLSPVKEEICPKCDGNGQYRRHIGATGAGNPSGYKKYRCKDCSGSGLIQTKVYRDSISRPKHTAVMVPSKDVINEFMDYLETLDLSEKEKSEMLSDEMDRLADAGY